MSDTSWMNIALEEARKGIGKTAPNPPVGAVIVKGGVLLGSGWHRAAGLPHAEREALSDAFEKHGRDAVRGATIYNTLEPCSTHGRTPPCTQGIIDAGIARVVYASVDRNVEHAGRADELLTGCAIRTAVESGELDAGRHESFLNFETEIAALTKRAEKRRMAVERWAKRNRRVKARNLNDRIQLERDERGEV